MTSQEGRLCCTYFARFRQEEMGEWFASSVVLKIGLEFMSFGFQDLFFHTWTPSSVLCFPVDHLELKLILWG